MSNVIPFPSRRDPFGSVIELAEVRAGLSLAAEHGMSQSDLQAVLDQDRPLATYALQLLGAEHPTDRRHGSVMLSRMAGTLSDPTADPPSAA